MTSKPPTDEPPFADEGGNIVAIGDVRDAVRGADHREPPPKRHKAQGLALPDGAPVVPLGYDDEAVYFIDASGQLRRSAAKSMGQLELRHAFSPYTEYLYEHWPRIDPSSFAIRRFRRCAGDNSAIFNLQCADNSAFDYRRTDVAKHTSFCCSVGTTNISKCPRRRRPVRPADVAQPSMGSGNTPKQRDQTDKKNCYAASAHPTIFLAVDCAVATLPAAASNNLFVRLVASTS